MPIQEKTALVFDIDKTIWDTTNTINTERFTKKATHNDEEIYLDPKVIEVMKHFEEKGHLIVICTASSKWTNQIYQTLKTQKINILYNSINSKKSNILNNIELKDKEETIFKHLGNNNFILFDDKVGVEDYWKEHRWVVFETENFPTIAEIKKKISEKEKKQTIGCFSWLYKQLYGASYTNGENNNSPVKVNETARALEEISPNL